MVCVMVVGKEQFDPYLMATTGVHVSADLYLCERDESRMAECLLQRVWTRMAPW